MMLHGWAFLLLPLAVRGVQMPWPFRRHQPPAKPQLRRVLGSQSIDFHAVRHLSSAFAGLSLEHQLEDRQRAFLCRGQKIPDPVFKEQRNLTFIHIPRCAGTSIEDCSAKEPLGWGSQSKELSGLYTVKRGQRCFKQHIPPTLVPELYTDKVTFCVVRNPYERMISEYHFPLTKGFGERARAGRCNKEGLNEFTIEALTAIKKKNDPYLHDCHLLPQAAYVYGWNATTMRVTREHTPWCKHKIRQEHLQEDFNTLMEENGYTYRLTSTVNPNTVAGPYWNCTHVTPEDFGPQALEMIHEFWKDDFELLNFTMLPLVDKYEYSPKTAAKLIGDFVPPKAAKAAPPKTDAHKAAQKDKQAAAQAKEDEKKRVVAARDQQKGEAKKKAMSDSTSTPAPPKEENKKVQQKAQVEKEKEAAKLKRDGEEKQQAEAAKLKARAEEEKKTKEEPQKAEVPKAEGPKHDAKQLSKGDVEKEVAKKEEHTKVAPPKVAEAPKKEEPKHDAKHPSEGDMIKENAKKEEKPKAAPPKVAEAPKKEEPKHNAKQLSNGHAKQEDAKKEEKPKAAPPKAAEAPKKEEPKHDAKQLSKGDVKKEDAKKEEHTKAAPPKAAEVPKKEAPKHDAKQLSKGDVKKEDAKTGAGAGPKKRQQLMKHDKQCHCVMNAFTKKYEPRPRIPCRDFVCVGS